MGQPQRGAVGVFWLFSAPSILTGFRRQHKVLVTCLYMTAQHVVHTMGRFSSGTLIGYAYR